MNDQSTILQSGNKRRLFLKQLLTGSVAALAYPVMAKGGEKPERINTQWSSDGDLTDERFWEQIKKQFTVPPNLMMVNAANLCPSPYFINDLVTSTMNNLEKDVSFNIGTSLRKKEQRPLKQCHNL